MFTKCLKAVTVVTALSTATVYPANALNMLKRNASAGCGDLVKVKHPNLKGKSRQDELAKCKADPAAYNQ